MELTKWTTVYKLTDQNGRTKGGCLWGRGVTNPHGPRDGRHGLCSDSFYHAYPVREVVGFLNPLHSDFLRPRLWLAEVRGRVETDGGLKFGATEMRTVRELPLVLPTRERVVAFSLYVAGTEGMNLGWFSPDWMEWADGWLSGADRSADAALRAGGFAFGYRTKKAASLACDYANNDSLRYGVLTTYDATTLHDAAVFALQFEA